MVVIFQAYFEYPLSMNSDVIQQQPQYFPAFSFCNVGELRYDQFIDPFLNYTNANNVTSSNDTTTITRSQASYIPNFLLEQLNQNKSLEQYFFSLSPMLYQCSFNSKPCSAADFISFTEAGFGSCYTFNPQLKNTTAQTPRYAILGDTGLQLGLYVYSQQYVPYVSDGIGMISLLHNNTQPPFLDLTGMYLSPGRKYKISYTTTITNYLATPNSQCTDDVPQSMQGILSNYPSADYGYSQALCIENNVQIQTYQQCGCVSPYAWDKRAITLPGTSNIFIAPLCNITDTCYLQAVRAYLTESISSNSNNFTCPKRCSNVNFPVEKSELSTPLEWQMSDIKSFVENSSVPLPANWSVMWRDYIRMNYLSINVVCETNVIDVNQQTLVYTTNTLISNIGAQAGLWLGLTVLVFAELIELLYHLLRFTFQKIRSKMQRNK
ncbi:unnamed protein product [Rotaria magnacalcarata]|uniref:Uncharacterized protein n=3 Tax=Rotaria magnacalcarata TaxID=392030 RepID=A0A814QDW2_9BILA|nr:unnamed protein product [Rotaria magnacalcarata]CAF1991814.1 unnamed protein product [Rotaria magnacalcarata]CAF3771806.1 unnamed protein product [Rotaria magnacalcarata]CAF3823513.1 unnamed protein product [Rotaria magnacalcarata]CAF4804838.1 unnamed protein product [Rotaria magnacalcarata]